MKLSILIVNWNTRDLVLRCIESVLDDGFGDFEVIVVDNKSRDDSVLVLRKKYENKKNVKIIESQTNLGFAKANNLAWRNSIGEYVFLLNPDTRIVKGALTKMISYMDRNRSTGALGPRLLNEDGTIQRSVRQFPNFFESLLVFSGLHRVFRPSRYLMDDFDYERESEVDQVMGAALLTRRDIIEKIGFFDENFWLWYEEVDLCKRIKQVGFTVMFFPEAEVIHHSAQSFSQMSALSRKKVVSKSIIYYFQKHGTRAQVFLIRMVVPVVLVVTWIIQRGSDFFGIKLHPHA